MTEQKVSTDKSQINPLLPLIDSEFGISSVRELISNAMRQTTPWDLPEDPEELKKILGEAIDHAVLLKKPQ